MFRTDIEIGTDHTNFKVYVSKDSLLDRNSMNEEIRTKNELSNPLLAEVSESKSVSEVSSSIEDMDGSFVISYSDEESEGGDNFSAEESLDEIWNTSKLGFNTVDLISKSNNSCIEFPQESSYTYR